MLFNMTHLITYNQEPEKVILVHVDFSTNTAKESNQEDLAEFQELARSAGAHVVAIITAARSVPDIKYFVGSGKAEEICMQVAANLADLVIFNHALTPAQERNLEKLFQCRVIDRTGLILDIFAQRARSFEGKLQVELARLQHMATRLVRGWTHLERQKGGIGLRGGPGEKQLEIDQRLIRKRIITIKERLAKVHTQRTQSRRARKRSAMPTIALVGYTNAGKSTLFNSLTTADTYVADKLFATLDPTLRSIDLHGFGKIFLADTVGFVRHLPHDLVDAFRATLDETREARLLLHIVDAHDPEHQEKILTVNTVLKQIHADKVPQLLVYNKIDLLEDTKARCDYNENGTPKSVLISAKSNNGLDLLLNAIRTILSAAYQTFTIELQPNEGQLHALLYENGAVLSEKITKNGLWRLTLSLPPESALLKLVEPHLKTK